MSPRCMVCNTYEAGSCGCCLQVQYCSLECQTADGLIHNSLCKELSKMPQRPTCDHKLGFLFPMAGAVLLPVPIWVKIRREEESDEDMPTLVHKDGNRNTEDENSQSQPETALFDDIDSELNAHLGHIYVQRNPCRGRVLDHTIELAFDKSFTSRIFSGMVNQSVEFCTQVQGHLHGHSWQGTVVMMAREGVFETSGSYQDATLKDVFEIIDYLGAFKGQSLLAKYTYSDIEVEHLSLKVEAVKIHCDGEMKLHNAEKFMAVTVVPKHPAFQAPVAPVSQRMGLGIRVWRYPMHERARDESAFRCNEPASYLQLDGDPKSDAWGMCPMAWTGGHVGSVLIVRENGRDIQPAHVEALAHYCQYELSRSMGFAAERGMPDFAVDATLEMMTPDAFEEFFEEYRARMLAEGKRIWGPIENPYDPCGLSDFD